jgi:hypothetical protein
MAVAEDRFFETRAAQLAIVHLTRHSDVHVTQEPQDYGVDLLVSLLEDGRNVGRLLAVQVKAVSSKDRISSKSTDQEFWRQEAAFHTFRLPLCLFVFNMENDQGYYRWVRQPDSSLENRRLVSGENGEFKALNKEALNKILDSVRAWYDF